MSLPSGEPLRLMITGHSQGVICSPRGGPRSDRTFAQWLERSTTRRGTPMEVTNTCVEVVDSSQQLARWPQVVAGLDPQVVVLLIGHAESFAGCTPMWVYRKFIGSERHAGLPGRLFARTKPRLWRMLRAYQRPVDRALGTRGARVRPERFERDLVELLGLARSLPSNPLVLVLEPSPLHKLGVNTPSGPARLDRNREIIHHVVARLADPAIRVLPTVAAVGARWSWEEAMPDGYHFFAPAHRRLAEVIADHVSDWEEDGGRPSTAPAPIERGLRVTVLTSAEVGVAGPGGYAERLGTTLVDGLPLDVRTHAPPGADVRLTVDAFQTTVQQQSPDVVVFHFGTHECSGWRRMGPRRFGDELAIGIELARKVSSPRILVVDVPGRDARGAALNDAIDRVVADAGGDVLRVRFARTVEELGARAFTAGGSLAEVAHERLAGLIVEAITTTDP